MPPDTERLDFELEIAAIVCRDVRNVTPEEARAAIGGYCVMNDWSARDIQGKEMKLKLGPSKGKDFATTIGPWVVTADELEGCRDADGFLDLEMTVKVNGVRVGGDRSAHMGWSFEQLVSHSSRASWVKAGEVLASGTCASGSLAESWGRTGSLTPPPLQVGDVVEMTIERLGTIRNTVVADTEDRAAGDRGPPRRPVRGECVTCRTSSPATPPPARSCTRYPAHDEAGVEHALADAAAAAAVWAATPLEERLDAAARGRQAADRAARGVRRPDHRRDGQADHRGAGRGRQVRLELRGRRRPRARLAGRPRGRLRAPRRSWLSYEPLGVVFAVMPWNFPFWQVLRFACAALAAGNAAVLKHSPDVTGCALAIEELFADAGAPAGLFRSLVVAAEDVPAVSRRVVEDPRVAAVTLTGSERAGSSDRVDRRRGDQEVACSSSAARTRSWCSPTPTSRRPPPPR